LIERVIDFDALEKINQAANAAEQDPEVDVEVKKMRVFDEEALAVGEGGEPELQKPMSPGIDIELNNLVSEDEQYF